MLPPLIQLLVTHPSQSGGPVHGFRFLWAFYVNGYHPERHCQPCLQGRRVREFATGTARVGVPVEFDRMDTYPFLYVCGVSSGAITLRRERNLHLPLAYARDGLVEATTYNGYHFRIEHARLLEVPPLPTGWEGRPEVQVRCRNYQFAVAYLGPGRQAPVRPTSSLPPAPGTGS